MRAPCCAFSPHILKHGGFQSPKLNVFVSKNSTMAQIWLLPDSEYLSHPALELLRFFSSYLGLSLPCVYSWNSGQSSQLLLRTLFKVLNPPSPAHAHRYTQVHTLPEHASTPKFVLLIFSFVRFLSHSSRESDPLK
jgi:hypothetical protein